MNKVNLRYIGIASLCGLFGAIYMTCSHKKPPSISTQSKVPSSPFAHHIVGIGVVEPAEKMLHLSFHQSGLIQCINVKVGQWVKKGEILCQLNQDEINVRIQILEATYKNSIIQEKKIKEQSEIAEDLHKKQVFSSHETRWNVYNAQQASAKREECFRHLQQAQLEKDQRCLRAPMDGKILSSVAHLGQYVAPGHIIFIMGDTAKLYVCVEFDEIYAFQVQHSIEAVGCGKSTDSPKIHLKLVYIDPYIYPKRNLPAIHSGVDTRIIRAYYSITSDYSFLMVGQELDVWIKTPSSSQ